MNEEFEFENLDDTEMTSNVQQNLPNATITLVLGILSIVSCWLYGVFGLILGIIGIVLHQKDKKLYEKNPAVYAQSYKNAKAGFICSIIGLSLSVLTILFFVFFLIFYFDEIIHNPSRFKF